VQQHSTQRGVTVVPLDKIRDETKVYLRRAVERPRDLPRNAAC
jgi:hypothetical protein